MNWQSICSCRRSSPSKDGYFVLEGDSNKQKFQKFVPLIMVLLSIFITMLLFFIYHSLFVWNQYSPVAVCVVAVNLCFSLVTLFLTLITDPGRLPKATFDETKHCLRYYRLSNQPKQDVYYMNINGKPWNLRYCSSCKFLRPPRCSHCRECDACILRFDHHCPWLGTCIGLRNYRYFFYFIVGMNALNFQVLTWTLIHFNTVKQDLTFLWAVKHLPSTFLILPICIISILPLFSLLIYHITLNARSLTTYQDLKSQVNPSVSNPFQPKYCCLNWLSVFCSYIPPDLYDDSVRSRYFISLSRTFDKSKSLPIGIPCAPYLDGGSHSELSSEDFKKLYQQYLIMLQEEKESLIGKSGDHSKGPTSSSECCVGVGQCTTICSQQKHDNTPTLPFKQESYSALNSFTETLTNETDANLYSSCTIEIEPNDEKYNLVPELYRAASIRKSQVKFSKC